MKTTIIYPPNAFNDLPDTDTIFLAGTIDNGKSEDWQQKTINFLQNIQNQKKITIFNPRRKNWDSSWKQEMQNPQFNEQVNWELNALERANCILMFFQKDSLSPISMLEMGLFADSRKMLVCCEKGFWRKGNIDIVCQRKNIPCFDTLEEMLNHKFSEFQ